MSNNKLYTLSYFRKRLKDVNIPSIVFVKEYELKDSRKWTISLFGKKHIFCTCMKEQTTFGTTFEFSDGGNYYKNRWFFCTESMQVIIEHLKKLQESFKEQSEDSNSEIAMMEKIMNDEA